MHNPITANNYVSCSGGDLGDPKVDPTGDDSVTLLIGAKVKDQALFSDDARTVTATIDPDHNITESHENNNIDNFTFHYN
jgi:hypothetical protein